MPLSPEDHIAITQLYAREKWALDFGDVEGYANCYTEDAVMESRAHICHGREDLRNLARELVNGLSLSTVPDLSDVKEFRHFVSNMIIDGDDTTANVKYYMLNVNPRGDRASLNFTSVHFDTVEKIDGSWFIKTRKAQADRPLGEQRAPITS
jgi:hypothetical protein